MKYQALTPKGIDVSIQKFQDYLHTSLITVWGLDANSEIDYLCFDRCFRNQKKDGFIPEVYKGNNEYKELLLNDKVKVQSFFGIGSSINYDSENQENTASVHLIFFVNLKTLKSNSNRPDEEVRQDVQNLLNAERNGLRLTSIQIGIDNVLNEYSGASNLLKFRDLNPYHAFRFNFDLTYNPQDHICT